MKKALAVLGVDPGSKGAFCLLVPETKTIEFIKTTEHALDLFNWVKYLDNEYNLAVCMIEEVGAIQGSAAKSTFSFGANVERVNIIPEIAQISVDKVRPKEWQKFIGLVTPVNMAGPSNAKKRKNYIKKEVADIASRLYPKAELHGPKGGLLDGRSDALMIAHYAARTINF
jgi:hypothetical protein|tara:strand:- start:94 stop:606 length:513 start_codon:yes stop_codon:yes gene_type:complete